MTDPLLEIADELYSLPLADFTPRRDALAKEHRGSDLAVRVKKLKKPTLAAWVVNLLVRRDPDQVTQVLEVGAALREAQAGLDATELRALTRQRRQLTAAVTTQARRTARGEGQQVTESVADQVEATLTAAMLDAGAAEAVRSGLLVAALAATGVDAVDAASAVALPEALGFEAASRPAEPPARPGLHVVPDPDAEAKARAAADEVVAAARHDHEQAAAALAEATADVEQLEARSLQLQAEVDEVRRRLAELESQQEDNDDELGDAEDACVEARQAADDAARALAEAEAARERLG